MIIDTSAARHFILHTIPRKRALLIIFLCMNAVYFVAYFQRVGVPGIIFDELQSAFHASASAVAGLGALYLYLYGGLQLFAGILNDRFGAARVLLTGGLLLCAGSILFPLAPTLPLLYLARVLVGLGASCIFLSIVKALDELFSPRHFAELLGLSMFLGCVGGVTGTLPFEHAVNAWGWRTSLLGLGIFSAAAFLATLIFYRPSRSTGRHSSSTPLSVTLKQVLGNLHSLPLLLSVPANFSIYFLLQSTLGKKFMTDFCGLPSANATTYAMVMMLITMSSMVLGGPFSRVLGNRRKPVIIISVLLVLTSLTMMLVGLVNRFSGGWFLVCYMMLALSTIASPVSNALMKELNPPDAIGTAIGLLNGGCYLIVAILTTFSGFIMDRFRGSAIETATAVIYPKEAYLTIFVLCMVISVGTLISSFFLRESYGKPVYGQENGKG